MKNSSYISERSAEYVLSAHLSGILKERYRHVIPLFPWAKREGSNLSLQLHAGHKFKILSVYARRPKLMSSEDTNIHFKFNETIVQGANEAEHHGIPSIAGCPIARNFFELAQCKEFYWVNLLSCLSMDVAPFIVVDKEGKVCVEYNPPEVFNDSEILKLIETRARSLDILQFMEAVKQIKQASGSMRFRGPFSYLGGYKPIYFLLA